MCLDHKDSFLIVLHVLGLLGNMNFYMHKNAIVDYVLFN